MAGSPHRQPLSVFPDASTHFIDFVENLLRLCNEGIDSPGEQANIESRVQEYRVFQTSAARMSPQDRDVLRILEYRKMLSIRLSMVQCEFFLNSAYLKYKVIQQI